MTVTAEMQQIAALKRAIDYRLNEVLCGMTPEHDDSVYGFNEAWSIVSEAFDAALSKSQAAPLPTGNVAEATVTKSCGCVFRDLDVPCRNPECKICHDLSTGNVGEAERSAAWLIERNNGEQPWTWYAEKPNGWHWWTPTAHEAKQFASRAEAEAFPAYQMIASDPAIGLTEHVFLAAPPKPVADTGVVTEKMVRLATKEYLSHKGETPERVLRGGRELWEDHAPAMRAALSVAALAAASQRSGQ